MSAVGPLKKPQLRGALASRLKFHAAIGFTVAISAAMIWKFGFAERRKQRYLDFYKNYDQNVDFERMKKAGVFQSVNADGSVGEL
ncbi:cytochrome c oxidase subunit 6C-like [Babylonia areolata]|uniref:cytochrome c oxidase subunit 6C-like n=1 Tax=Babylonia areolata TaxID=304850 RepID=UPI003FD053CD